MLSIHCTLLLLGADTHWVHMETEWDQDYCAVIYYYQSVCEERIYRREDGGSDNMHMHLKREHNYQTVCDIKGLLVVQKRSTRGHVCNISPMVA